jgi:hypothetical protein
MTRLTRLCRTVGVGIAVTTATLAMTQVAHAQLPPPKIQPAQAAIKAPPGNIPFLIGHATGVQTYACNGGQLATTGSVPTADLVDDGGNIIVRHAGATGQPPTWTSEADKSAVKGARKEGVPSPSSPPSIDWLLLTATPIDGAPTGLLTDTTFIQRVNTTGGVSPGGACTKELAVPYTADYYFYRAAGKPSTPGKPGG